MGAAGRNVRNFNMAFGDDAKCEVIAITAAQRQPHGHEA
jgi:hypothetical protein